MMQSLLGVSIPDPAYQIYSAAPIYDEYSRQLALVDSTRRMSRSSAGHRPANTMRVVKPSSANNSPQAMMARRRTVINDENMARRRQYALDQAFLQHIQGAPSPYDSCTEPVKRTNRPVSWHPSSHMQQPQVQMHQQIPHYDIPQYVMPTPAPYPETDFFSGYQPFPPTPAAYSGHSSPISSFSPLSLPFAAASSQPPVPPAYVSTENWNAPAQYTSPTYITSGSPVDSKSYTSYSGQTSSSLNWDAFTTHGFSTCTAPPTPDDFQPVTQPEPDVPSEESIPFKPLDDPEEEEGEILVGMGLYDTPDKTETDPELDNYRITTSHLLGTTYRKGAGLKLEEAWEPPAKEEDDEDDSEEDANGEDQ